MKHLVSINDLTSDEIKELFIFTKKIKENPKLYSDKLSGKILTNLFYEPSTRTSTSFHSAMLRIGGNVISINDVTYSSVSKGENLEDTIITMGNYSDIIVLRSIEEGDAHKASMISTVPIINAGDGSGEHPTQTLLDLYTIYEKYNKINGLTITFLGDMSGRTVHSLHKALQHKCDFYLNDTYDVHNLPKSDVYYFTRVQRERGSVGSYQLTEEHVKQMPKNCMVMHPFPRNEEIPQWFDNDPRAYYFEQMKNGLYIRMALLILYSS